MSYLEKFEKLNIKFDKIDKSAAEEILRTEYPYYKLLEYSVLFDTYRSTEKAGTFVNLDFYQLYSLAGIDEELCNLIMCAYLEIERTLKAYILDYKLRYALPSDIVKIYVETDEEYLSKVYTVKNRQVLLKYPNVYLKDLGIEQFLDVIQAGTFDRFYNYVYKNYLDGKEEFYGGRFSCAHRLRNIAAHYESLLSQLDKPAEGVPSKAAAYLGTKFNKKTFSTNMSKSIIFDLCNMMYLYRELQPEYKIFRNYERWHTFFTEFCAPYLKIFKDNNALRSAYKFVAEVVEIFKTKS